jgi:hypothetical protein
MEWSFLERKTKTTDTFNGIARRTYPKYPGSTVSPLNDVCYFFAITVGYRETENEQPKSILLKEMVRLHSTPGYFDFKIGTENQFA